MGLYVAFATIYKTREGNLNLYYIRHRAYCNSMYLKRHSAADLVFRLPNFNSLTDARHDFAGASMNEARYRDKGW